MKTRRAFTLIELLVVVAIICVLLAIMLPAMSRAQDMAQLASCQSNLKQLGSGMALYSTDNNGIFPCWGWEFLEPNYNTPVQPPNVLSPSGAMPAAGLKTGLIWPYASNEEVYRCSVYPTRKANNAAGNPIWGFPPYFTYMVNGQAGYSINNPNWYVTMNTVRPGPNQVMMLMECNDTDISAFDNGVLLFAAPYGPGTTDSLGVYHLNGGNMVMYDGHTQYMNHDDYLAKANDHEQLRQLVGGEMNFWWP